MADPLVLASALLRPMSCGLHPHVASLISLQVPVIDPLLSLPWRMRRRCRRGQSAQKGSSGDHLQVGQCSSAGACCSAHSHSPCRAWPWLQLPHDSLLRSSFVNWWYHCCTAACRAACDLLLAGCSQGTGARGGPSRAPQGCAGQAAAKAGRQAGCCSSQACCWPEGKAPGCCRCPACCWPQGQTTTSWV